MTTLIMGTAGKLLPRPPRMAAVSVTVRAAAANATLSARCGVVLREGGAGAIRGRTLDRCSRRRSRFSLGVGRGGAVAALRHAGIDEDEADVR